VAGFAIALTACTSTKAGQQPSWRGAARPEGEASAGPREAGRKVLQLGPTSQVVRAYAQSAGASSEDTPLREALVNRFVRAARERGRPVPETDARLDRALTELAAITPEDTPLPYSMVEFAMHRNGIIEPSPHLVVIWGDEDNPQDILDQLEERMDGIMSSGVFRRIGVGSAPHQSGGDIVILALQEVHLQIKPVPRQLASEGKAIIEGHIDRSFHDPHIYLARDDGTVDKLAVARFDATGIRATLECAGRKGPQQVEITAEDSGGSTVLANFPVYCGVVPPQTLSIAADRVDRAAPSSQEEAEERMLQLVNEDRAQQKLPPLSLDPRLVAVARSHSQEMHDTGIVAHVSPRTGDASDRVKAANIKSAVVLENVARAYGVGEAQEGLMNSPGHRANILSRDATQVGIGIVLGEEVSGRRELLITQLFTRVPGPIDPMRVRQMVRKKILATRKLESDPTLDVVAQEFANDLVNGATTEAASTRAAQRLDKVGNHLKRVATLVTAVTDITSFDPKGALGGERLRWYGLGIAQGTHAVMGEQAIHIVVLLGEQ
jgi:uncharacterized protein YkwD